MLMIRLFRTGKKNQPSFKVVVTEKTNAPSRGRFTEEVGFFNPLTKEKILKKDRVEYWIKRGAQPSDTVYNMMVEAKIVEGKKRSVPMKKKKEETKPGAKK
ncbi:MAG: 30S ribosomal protein S16 [Candidatus Paceibacterota bacterium]